MSFRNNITLVGRLTKDIDLRITPNGVPVARGNIAVTSDYKNQNNEYEADFFNFVVWRKLAENMANHLSKGDLIGINGRLQSGSYEKDGQKVYTVDVLVESADFLKVKKWNNPSSNQKPTNPYSNTGGSPFDNNGPADFHDDDLPF